MVAPVGTGYGAAAIDIPEQGLYGPFFSKIGNCTNPDFHSAGLAVAQVDRWTSILPAERIVPRDHRRRPVRRRLGFNRPSNSDPPEVKAIITFAAGRGGGVDGKPDNNCAPDRLVEATRFRQHVADTDAVDLYRERHFFRPGPVEAHARCFHGRGWKAEYHLLPPFGDDGHFLIGSANSIPIWSPLVERFLSEVR